jgi:hypothetical protein
MYEFESELSKVKLIYTKGDVCKEEEEKTLVLSLFV